MTAAVRLFLEFAADFAPEPWRDRARVALADFLSDAERRATEAARGRRRRAHASGGREELASLSLGFEDQGEREGELEREDALAPPESGVYLSARSPSELLKPSGEEAGDGAPESVDPREVMAATAKTRDASASPSVAFKTSGGARDEPKPGMVPGQATSGQPRATALLPRAGPDKSAAILPPDDVRAFGEKLGLDPLEVEAAALDHREFLRSHPKSKQTLTSCLLHHARKKRERGPAQQELPGVVARPAVPPPPQLWCLRHGYRCKCPDRVRDDCISDALVRAREDGPGLARAAPDSPTETEKETGT